MANFAVAAADDVIARGNSLLESMAKPGEKKGDTLSRLFKVLEEQQEEIVIKEGGVDIQALEAALSNIRTMFASVVDGKSQIIAEKDIQIAKIKALKERREEELSDQLAVARTEREQAVKDADAAERAAVQAEREVSAAKEQAKTASNLVAEKDRTISMLSDKLTLAEEKASRYDALASQLAEAQEVIKALRQEAENTAKENERAAERAQEAAVRAQEAAVKEVTTAMTAKLEELRENLIAARSDAALARRDVELARTETAADLTQKHAASTAELVRAHADEVASLRAKLDARTDELLQASRQIAALQLELRNAQAASELLEKAGSRKED